MKFISQLLFFALFLVAVSGISAVLSDEQSLRHVEKRGINSTSDSKCDLNRQKCIKVCANGSRSPACYRNCTSLYNDCKEKELAAKKKAKPVKCNSERQTCIKVCDKGSRSPACYRNCTSLFNQCELKNKCDSERQKCIKVCDKGSKSPACYRNCTALYNKCIEKQAKLYSQQKDATQ